MFQFSAFAPLKLWIHFRVTALIALPGFPIQKSSDHSSFDNSPKLFAVYYVFHRLSAPRHPPCALYSLISIPLLRSRTLCYCDVSRRLWHLMFNSNLSIAPLTIISIAFFSSVVIVLRADLFSARQRGRLIRVLVGLVKFYFLKM